MLLDSIIEWISKEKGWVFSGIGVSLVIGILNTFKFFFGKQSKIGSSSPGPLLEQNGTVYFIQGTKVKKQEVFYPIPFAMQPHIETHFSEGQYDNLELTEQRSDGFVIEVGGASVSSGSKDIKIQWVAKGLRDKKP